MEYSPVEIEKILSSVLEASKSWYSKNMLKTLFKKDGHDKEKDKYPDYFSWYKQACKMRDSILVHAEPCDFPESLFRVKAPRMDEEAFEYLEANFKKTTNPVYMDFLSTVNRIFNDTSWSIEYKDNEDPRSKEFHEYCEGKVPIYGSIEDFSKSILPHIKMTDASGCLVIKPHELKFIESGEMDSAGKPLMKLDNSVALEPRQFYYRVDQLVSFKEGEYFMFELDEKSEVDFNGKKQSIGRVFEFYDKNSIYRIQQIGKFTDHDFETLILIEHKWGRIPVEFLKGIPRITKDGIMQISPFFYAVDLLDLMLLNESSLQLSMYSCMFPHKVYAGDECTFTYTDANGNSIRCNEGDIHLISEDRTMRCPGCGGSGVKSRMGPLGAMIIRQTTEEEGKLNPIPGGAPIQFISPDSSPLDFVEKKIQGYEQKARKILHLSTTQSQVQPDGQKFATGMMLDLKALYAFVKSISDQIFNLIRFQYEAFAMYIFGPETSAQYVPTVVDPVSYDFRTEADYLKEISDATESQLPPYVIQTIVYRYIKALYFNDPYTAGIFMLLVATDRLLVFSSEQISDKLNMGLIEDWEIVLHDTGLSLINQLASENPKFFTDSVPFEKRKQMLIERATKVASDAQQANADKKQMQQDSLAKSILSIGQVGSGAAA